MKQIAVFGSSVLVTLLLMASCSSETDKGKGGAGGNGLPSKCWRGGFRGGHGRKRFWDQYWILDDSGNDGNGTATR